MMQQKSLPTNFPKKKFQQYFQKKNIQDLFPYLIDNIEEFSKISGNFPENILVHTYPAKKINENFILENHGELSRKSLDIWFHKIELDQEKTLYFAADLHQNFGDYACKIYRENFQEKFKNKSYPLKYIGQAQVEKKNFAVETRGELEFLIKQIGTKKKALAICTIGHLPHIQKLCQNNNWSHITPISSQTIFIYYFDWKNKGINDFFQKYPQIFQGITRFWYTEKIKIKLTKTGKFLQIVAKLLGPWKQRLLEKTQKF